MGNLGRVGSPSARRTVTFDNERLLKLATFFGSAALILTLFVAWHGSPLPGDLGAIRAVQDWTFARRFEGVVNALGRFEMQLLVALVCLALVAFGPRLNVHAGSSAERTVAAWSLIAALGLRFIASPLKSMAQGERPSSAYDLRITQHFPGYGFPSGHVLGDVVIFGTLAVVAPAIVGRTAGAAARVFCLAAIVLAGPARMTVGAHWPSDVAGGYLWGACALCVAIFLGRRLSGSR